MHAYMLTHVMNMHIQTRTRTNIHARRYGISDTSKCKHSPFLGAYNYMTVSIQPSTELAAGSTITITGINSPISAGPMPVLLRGITSTVFGATKNKNVPCVCYAQGCSCEHTFLNIPKVSDVKLRAQIQCNAYGWGAKGGQNITVRVGFDKNFTNQDPEAAPFAQYVEGNFCEDNCGTFNDLFDPAVLDVADTVHSSGALFVSVHSTSAVDFCGKGEFIRANLTLTWVTEAKDITEVTGTYNKTAGSVNFTVPPNFKILNSEPTFATVYVRNPEEPHDGMQLSIAATSATGTKVGPTKIPGKVLVANKRVRIDTGRFFLCMRMGVKKHMLVLSHAFAAKLACASIAVFSCRMHVYTRM
jgi:hypothetical protein